MRERRINQVSLLAGMLSTLSLCGIVVGVHYIQRNKICSTLLARADFYEKEKDLEKVEGYLFRCLTFDPKNAEGQLRYAMLRSEPRRWEMLDWRQREDAYVRLLRVSDLFPENIDLWERIAFCGMRFWRFADSLKTINEHLLSESPQNLDYLTLKAKCLTRLAEYSMAEESWIKITQVAPEQLDAYVAIASLRRDHLEKPDDADQIINDMVTNNLNNPLAYRQRVLWNLHRRDGFAKRAILGEAIPEGIEEELNWAIRKDYESALALKPDDSDCIRSFSQYWIGVGEFDEARERLQLGLKVDPADLELQYELANLEHQAGNRKLGLDSLKTLVANHPDRQDWKCRLAELGIVGPDENVLDDAAVAELIQDLRDSKEIPAAEFQFLEACVDWRDNRWGAVVTKLAPIRQSLDRNPGMAQQADYFLAVAYTQLHAPERALQLFRACVDHSLDSVPAQRGMAGVLHSLNRRFEAIDEWRKIVAKPGATVDDWIQFAHCLHDGNLAYPSDQRNWYEFDQVLNHIAEADPNSLVLADLKLKTLRAKNRAGAGQEALAAARQVDPANPQFLEMEFNWVLTQRDWDAAENVLRAEKQQHGDTPQWRLHQAQLAVERESKATAKALLQDLSQPSPAWSAEQQSLLAAGFAELFEKIQEFDEADQLLEQAQTAKPHDIDLMLSRLRLAFQLDKLDRVDDLLNQYEQRFGKNALWHLERARRVFLLRNQSLKQQTTFDPVACKAAIMELEIADRIRPDWGELHVLWGEILILQGDLDGGVSQYLTALNGGFESAEVTSKVVDLMMNFTQRYDDADQLLKRHRAFGYPLDDQLRHEEINLAIALGRKDVALKRLRELPEPAVPASVETPYLQPAWRGECYLSLGQNELAEKHFRRALLASPNPVLLPSLVTALLNQQQRDNAIKAIEGAKETMALDKTPLILARCYERLRELPIAEEWYREALHQSPDELENQQGLVSFLIRTNRLEDAESEIRRILQRPGSVDPRQPQGAWCRFTLAEILLRQGKKLTEGLTLLAGLGERPGGAGDSVLRLKSKIQEKLSSRANLDQAISILTQLESRPLITAANTEDRWRLAQLCFRVGDSSRGRQVLLAAINASKTLPRFEPFKIRCSKEYVVKSLKFNELSEAKLHLAFLQQLAPDQPEAKDAEIYLLESQKQYPEIKQSLQDFHKKWLRKNESAEHAVMVNAWIAKRYERVADSLSRHSDSILLADEFYQRAADHYRENVKLTEAAKWDLASLLVKTGQVEQGLGLLESGLNCPPVEKLIQIKKNLMENPCPAAKTVANRMIAVFSNSEKNVPPAEVTVLKLLSANLFSWIGDDDAAEIIYQDLLTTNENDYTVLNSYAFFLAVTDRELALAATLVNRAISIAGPLPALVDTRGYVSLMKGDPANAASDFVAAVSASESPVRYLHLALAYSELRQPQLAAEALNRANAVGLTESALQPRQATALRQLVVAFSNSLGATQINRHAKK